MGRKMSDVKKDLMKDEEFQVAFIGLEDEFALAAQLIEARKKAHLTQDEVARRMGTTQSVVARLESGHPVAKSAVTEEVRSGCLRQGRDKSRVRYR